MLCGRASGLDSSSRLQRQHFATCGTALKRVSLRCNAFSCCLATRCACVATVPGDPRALAGALPGHARAPHLVPRLATRQFAVVAAASLVAPRVPKALKTYLRSTLACCFRCPVTVHAHHPRPSLVAREHAHIHSRQRCHRLSHHNRHPRTRRCAGHSGANLRLRLCGRPWGEALLRSRRPWDAALMSPYC